MAFLLDTLTIICRISQRLRKVLTHGLLSRGNLDTESDKIIAWKEAHEPHCQINHEGSSRDMDSKGAIAMFSRNIEKYQLKYSKFVGDRDSSSFGSAAKALIEMYGDTYVVTKEECVCHVQKRTGAALIEYKKANGRKKLADGKNVGGQERLTEDWIHKIQNYYGFAIRQNSGNLEGMKQAVLAIQHHVIR